MLSCEPTFATQRTDRESFGPEIAGIAEALGQPFMPWQELVANVGGERLENGLPAYREVIVTVPRQSGKTILEFGWQFHRALMWGRPQSIVYTAQTGQDAREKLVEDIWEKLIVQPNSPLKATIRQVKRAMAATAMMFKNGSRIDVLATGQDSGHGKSLDLGVIDEAFADSDFRREQGIRPTMATRPDAQILVMSTAGTDASVFLNHKVEVGRDAVRRGLTQGVAYFEWSAPDDVDVHDPDEWWGWMPALGHTITPEVVEADSVGMTDGEFRRAYGNQRTRSDDRVVPVDRWAAVCSANTAPEEPLVFAADADPQRRWASVAVADVEGRAELVEHREGVGWLEDWFNSRPKVRGLVEASGPAGFLVERCPNVEGLPKQGYAFACGEFMDKVMDGRVSVRSHSKLDEAAAAARTQSAGEQWVWKRKHQDSVISPLVAVTLALAGASKPSDEKVKVSVMWV